MGRVQAACMAAAAVVCGGCRIGFDASATNVDGRVDPCDEDNDGFASTACGGLDCDDSPLGCGAGCYPAAVELCDGYDNDCDASTLDGSTDPSLGAPCDGQDLDFCREGTWSCDTAALACDDATSSISEICTNAIDDNCNGQTDEGCSTTCSPNSNPGCTATALGSVKGDEGADQLLISGADEAWYQVTIGEKSWSSINLNAEILLHNGPGADFDVFVYCASCGGTLLLSSTAVGAGGVERLSLGKRDDGGTNDGFDVIVEIRYRSHTTCGGWTLEVRGNSGGGNKGC